MFLHEMHCPQCEKTTAHANGECMTCKESYEKNQYDVFKADRRDHTLEERIEWIKDRLYEMEKAVSKNSAHVSLHTPLG